MLVSGGNTTPQKFVRLSTKYPVSSIIYVTICSSEILHSPPLSSHVFHKMNEFFFIEFFFQFATSWWIALYRVTTWGWCDEIQRWIDGLFRLDTKNILHTIFPRLTLIKMCVVVLPHLSTVEETHSMQDWCRLHPHSNVSDVVSIRRQIQLHTQSSPSTSTFERIWRCFHPSSNTVAHSIITITYTHHYWHDFFHLTTHLRHERNQQYLCYDNDYVIVMEGYIITPPHFQVDDYCRNITSTWFVVTSCCLLFLEFLIRFFHL